MNKVVFIAGMHRSGTSMVTRLLNLCGVYLGQESDFLLPGVDNSEGYWENAQFMSINNKLLSELNGGWDYPPKVSLNWFTSNKLSPIRSEALELIQQFSAYKLWGWKDPRNSLTFSFWNDLIPSMKVIICVRNPLEVFHSLWKRNYFSSALALSLWFEYNQRILSESQPQNRIITHYESYFQDPYSELQRILRFLELDIPDDHVRQSVAVVDERLRHNRFAFSDLFIETPSKVMNLYQKLCDPGDVNSESHIAADVNLQNSEYAEENIDTLSVKLRGAKNIIAEKEKNIQILQAQFDAKERELADIYQSKAWRLIHTVRRIRQKFLG
jgi:hypothetical protein